MIRSPSTLALMLALGACSGGTSAPDASASPTPSVMVGLVRPERGSLPQVVTAYGAATPSEMGTRTLTEAQPGQVTRLLVAPGSVVRAGQALAVFVTAPSSRSAYEQAVSALATARKQRATTAQLLSQQLATTDQLTQAEKAVSDAQTALAALRAEGAGTPVHQVTSPFGGIVTAVPVAQGDRTPPGAAIVSVARAGGIVVTAGVDPAARPGLRVGQSATITRLSGGPSIAGRVVRIDGSLNPTTRLVDVDLTFPTGALLAGEAMQVAIETGRVQGWVVPHASVVTGGDTPHVFQVVAGKARAVPVALRLAGADRDVVEGPIDPNRPLVVSGAYQLGDGDAVRRGG